MPMVSKFKFFKKSRYKQCGTCLKVKPPTSFDRCTSNSISKLQTSCKPCIRKAVKSWRQDHRDYVRRRARTNAKAVRALAKVAVISHYSHGTNRCSCCGEKEFDFLSIDHVHGGGRAHHRRIRRHTPSIYLWLFWKKFPKSPKLRVLCFNCNMARGFHGTCPHERRSK